MPFVSEKIDRRIFAEGYISSLPRLPDPNLLEPGSEIAPDAAHPGAYRHFRYFEGLQQCGSPFSWDFHFWAPQHGSTHIRWSFWSLGLFFFCRGAAFRRLSITLAVPQNIKTGKTHSFSHFIQTSVPRRGDVNRGRSLAPVQRGAPAAEQRDGSDADSCDRDGRPAVPRRRGGSAARRAGDAAYSQLMWKGLHRRSSDGPISESPTSARRAASTQTASLVRRADRDSYQRLACSQLPNGAAYGRSDSDQRRQLERTCGD